MSENMFTCTTATAKLPTKATPEAAGFDLFCDLGEDVVLNPGELLWIPTGVRVNPMEGFTAKVESRSGLSSKSIDVKSATGDLGEDGSIQVLLGNSSKDAHTFSHHQRIAQLVVYAVQLVIPVVVDDVDATQRGSGGFGSTGTH